MEPIAYKVKTQSFEGPLDLLLDLIEKRKLFVSDISLSEVTDDFISYIKTHEEFPISESAEFILIASTLMLIKSRSLLPSLELTEEEESSIDDLENRLREYAMAKAQAQKIREMFGKNIIFEKIPVKKFNVVFSPTSEITIDAINESMERIFMSLPKKEIVPKAIVKKMISLEETIEKLSERISKNVRMSFKEYTNHSGGKITQEEKVMIIVGFLAMLELVKRGAIRVSQEEKGEIEIESDGIGLPTYN